MGFFFETRAGGGGGGGGGSIILLTIKTFDRPILRTFPISLHDFLSMASLL